MSPVTVTAGDIIEQFRSAIQSAGMTPPDAIEANGELRRFAPNGDPRDDAGWYVLHDDGIPAGAFGNWRTGETQNWRADVGRKLTRDEERQHRERTERARAQRAQDEAQRHQDAARRAQTLWSEATAADQHPYLSAKNVHAHGARVHGNELVVPVRNANGDLLSLQFIDAEGGKRFLAGGQVAGGYFSIGKPEDDLLIAEGFATGASLHEATGKAVAIAFNAGNLKPVAAAMRAKFPTMRIVVCGDDDYRTDGNPGKTKATEAASAIGAAVALPDFGDDRPEGATDFNDLMRHRGAEAVQQAIANAQRPAVPEVPAVTPNGPSANLSVEITRADSIQPEAFDWLWNGYLAAGKLHIMAGAPGTGKTTLAIGLAAALTSGGRWPDAARASSGAALIWSGEDSPKDTLVPRLIAAGAALDRVHFVGDTRTPDGPRGFDPSEDFALLEIAAARIDGLRLVIVDPIVSAIAGDSHKNAEVRRGLDPLVRFAERTGCAVLGISHFSKGTAGRDPIERVTGSIAFGAVARVVLATAKLSDDEGGGRIMVRAKSNIGPDGGGFRYDLRLVELGAKYAGVSAARPEWLGPVEGEARELLAAAETQGDPEERSATVEAADMLREMLLLGRVETREALRKLKSEGFTDKQIRRARESLNVRCDRAGFGGKGFWSLPHSCPDPSIVAHSCPTKLRGITGQQWEPEGINDGGAETVEVAV